MQGYKKPVGINGFNKEVGIELMFVHICIAGYLQASYPLYPCNGEPETICP